MNAGIVGVRGKGLDAMNPGITQIASAWNPRSVFIVVAVLLFAAVPVVAVHLGSEVVPEDDAFIVYRYVDRLTSGAGLVYNEGERVFGVTSPLYVAWLAVLKSTFPGVAIPVLSVRWNLVFYLTAAAALWLALERLAAEADPPGRPVAWATAGTAAFLVQPEMMRISIGGMEPFLFLTLVVGAVAASFHGRTRLAFFTAGMATLARPEGVVLFAVLVLARARSWNRRDIVHGALAYAVPLLCWAIPATAYFESPIPHSIIAKSAPLYPLEIGAALFATLDQFGSWGLGRALTDWSGPGTVLAVLAHVLAAVGAVLAGARSRSVLVLLVLLVVFYGVGNPLIFEWYWPSLYGAWFLVWLAGGMGWTHRWGSFFGPGAVGKWTLPVLLAAWWVGTAGLDVRDRSRLAKPAMEAGRGAEALSLGRSRDPVARRIDTYREIAHWLNANTHGAVVASAEIGALGFYYAGAILDTCGLVSPEAVPFHPVPLHRRGMAEISAIPRELVQSELPDYVVSMHVFAYKTLFDWDWFARNYRVARTFPLVLPGGHPLWGGREVAVYRRTGSSR